jgi:hypothetical protein
MHEWLPTIPKKQERYELIIRDLKAKRLRTLHIFHYFKNFAM